MAISRIDGTMLEANLLRQGDDFAVETDLIYFDVANSRIGIGNAGPSTTLEVTGTSTFDNLSISTNTISSDNLNGDITLDPNGTGEVHASAPVRVGTSGVSNPVINFQSNLVTRQLYWNTGPDRLYVEVQGGGSWQPVVYSGDGSFIDGSISDNQIAVGSVTANEIEGDANLTWDGTVLTAGNIEARNTQPQILLYETDAAVDEKYWYWEASAGALRLRMNNDAFSFNTTLMTFERTTTTFDSATINADFNVVGGINVSGNIIPDTDDSRDLGSVADSWRRAYLTDYLNIDDTTPQVRFYQNNGALDQKYWFLQASGEGLEGLIYSDNLGNSYKWMEVERSGTGAGVQVDTIDLTAVTDVQINSTLNVQGNITTTGTVDGVDIANDVVTKVGTPVNNEISVWTGDGTLEGESNLTFVGGALTCGISAGGEFRSGAGQTLGIAPGTGGVTLSMTGSFNSSGTGGAVNIFGGTSTNASSPGGAVTITGGSAGSAANGGNVDINGATGGATSGGGGSVLIDGGDGTGTGAGGSVQINGGDGDTTGSGGTIFITGGTRGASGGGGGSVNLTGGVGGAVGPGATVTGGTGNSTNAVGGAATLRGGAGAGTSPGGDSRVTGGNGGATGDGGQAEIVGGDGGATSGNGGDVTIAGGTGDTDGDILLNSNVFLSTTLRFTERADHALTPTATFGELWVRNDAPNKLIFTDDAGTDFDLTAGGNVGNTGTPLNNQIAIFTDATTVEGDANLTWDGNTLSATTGGAAAQAGYFYSNIASRTTPVLEVVADHATGGLSGGALKVQQDAPDYGIDIDHNGSTGNALQINSASANDGIRVVFGGSGNGINIDSDTSTSGSAARFYSNTASRIQPLVEIINDNATGAGEALYVQNDQSGNAITSIGNVDVTGDITVSGTVDGVDIAARDHDAVTKAGTGTYISLAGQVITVDPITESDISDLQSYSVISGTPANNQLAVWTGATDIEGAADLTWDGSILSIGTSDTTRGIIRMFSGPTANAFGGLAYFDVSPDYDTSVSLYQIEAFEDTFRMGSSNNPTFHILADGSSRFDEGLFVGTDTLTGANQNDVTLFSNTAGTAAQSGAFNNALVIYGGSSQTRTLELKQNVSGNAEITGSFSSNILDITNFASVDIAGTLNSTSSATGTNAGRFYSNTASRTVPVVDIVNDNTTGTGGALKIQQDQGGTAVEIDSNSNGVALLINQVGTGNSVDITHLGGAGNALDIDVQAGFPKAIYAYSNVATRTQSLVDIVNDNATGTGRCLTIQQDQGGDAIYSVSNNTAARAGYFYSNTASRTASVLYVHNDNATGTGTALRVLQDQGGDAIDITVSNVASSAIYGYSNVASRTAPLCELISDSPTGSGDVLVVRQDAAAGKAISAVGDVEVSGDLDPTVTNTQDIGQSGLVWANVWATTFEGTATTAQYADLAEKYLTDNDYEIGTVLMFGGEFEVTEATPSTTAIAGIVSEHPAFLMNKKLANSSIVALRGRVPCKVYGPVSKGDLMVAGVGGVAVADNNANPNAVLGRAIANNESGFGTIEVVV